MVNQLQLELLKKHVGPFFFCFFTVMFILLMQFLILHVDKLVGKGLEFTIVVELIMNNLAYMVVLAVPMAVLVSTLIAFGRFSEWNELTAVKAAGINPFSLIKPVLLVGTLLFVGLSYFSNEILPEANHKARSLFIDIRMQQPAFDLQPGVFYDGIEGYTFLVREMPAASDTLYDVTLFKEKDRDRPGAYIKAERGWLESPDEITLSLFLQNGTIVRTLEDGRNEERIERSSFNLYRMSFDLSDLAFSRTNPEQRSRNDRTMSSRAMRAVIDTLQVEREKQFRQHMDNGGHSLTRGDTTADETIAGGSRLSEDEDPHIFDSSFFILNDLPDSDLQARALSVGLSNIGNFRNELDNLSQSLRWRDIRMAEFWVEIHKKFSIPFACIIFILLGAPIGMMTRNGNIGIAAIISAVLLTIYFIAIIQGEKWADRMFISPFIGMWGINILMGIAGIILTLKVSTSFRFKDLLPER